LEAQLRARDLFLHPDLAKYAQSIVDAMRKHPRVRLGVSTRGALAWVRAARARAYLQGRTQVAIDDLQELAVGCLAHRVLLVHGSEEASDALAEDLVRELLATIPVPR